MKLKSLQIRQFRNIAELSVTPDPVLNLLIGDNAQGKTSLVEAIFFLSTLRSFRTSKTMDLIQMGKGALQLEAQVQIKTQTSPLSLKVRIQDGKRQLFLNDKAVPASRFITQLRAVVFSPESLQAIKLGPEARRELVDQAVFQVSQEGAESQMAFGKALKQRNALLRQIRDQLIAPQKGRAVLESLDEVYIRYASDVIFCRLQFLDNIFEIQKSVFQNITGENANLEFSYRSQDKVWKERRLDSIQHRVREELRDPRRMALEEALGQTQNGPHRHDLSFLFNGNDSRIFCSQGQQRALILAFKIAEIVYHGKAFNTYPLLLLDDVLSELDEKKKKFLIDFLRTNEAQTFLTTTDQAQALGGCTIFQIAEGRVSNQKRG